MFKRSILLAGILLSLATGVWAQQPGQPGLVGNIGGAVNIDGIRTQINATEEEWKAIGPIVKRIIAARQAIVVANNPTIAGNQAGRGGPGGGGNNSFTGPGDTATGSMGGGPGGGGPGGRGGPGGGANPGGFNPGGPMQTVPDGNNNNGGNSADAGGAGQTHFVSAPPADAGETPASDEVKLAATRAIKKATGDLEAAQKELKAILTPEQQAVMVKLGYLNG